MSELSKAGDGTGDDAAFDAQCAAWLGAMAQGEERALEQFYEATLHRAFAVAVRVLADASLAEDVVADAYHEAWKHAGSYSVGKGRPVTWFLTICRNRALDEYRRRAANARKVESAAAEQIAESVIEPDVLLESVQRDHVVHAMLLAMSADDRQLIALAFFRGMSHQQIADVTCLPLGTVKSRIRRALAALERSAPSLLEA